MPNPELPLSSAGPSGGAATSRARHRVHHCSTPQSEIVVATEADGPASYAAAPLPKIDARRGASMVQRHPLHRPPPRRVKSQQRLIEVQPNSVENSPSGYLSESASLAGSIRTRPPTRPRLGRAWLRRGRSRPAFARQSWSNRKGSWSKYCSR